jgi:Histidinol dehydrogenase
VFAALFATLIFADGAVDGRIAALDVLIEAEHGPDSSAYLVTHSREVAEAAQAALPEYWARMARSASPSRRRCCAANGAASSLQARCRSPMTSSTPMRRSNRQFRPWAELLAANKSVGANLWSPVRNRFP